MNVAFVTAEYPPKNIGGAGISSKLIVERLRQEGVSVDVYALNGEKQACVKKKDGHYELPSRTAWNIPEIVERNLNPYRYLPDMSKYDLVHTYSPEHIPAVTLRSDVPVIATVVNFGWVCINSQKYLQEGCPEYGIVRAVRNARDSYSRINALLALLVEAIGKSIAKRVDLITVQTEAMRRILSSCGYDITQIRVVPNLLDPAFQLDSRTDPSKSRTLVTVGRLTEQKGIFDIVRVFTNLPSELRADWRLQIYGSGPLEKDIEQYLQRQGESQVELSYCPYDEMAQEVYREAAAVIHGSKWPEPFSRVWLEAMATGTPIICSKNPSSNCVLDGIAELYDPFDMQSLRRTLIGVMQSPNYRDRLSRLSQQAAPRYNPDQVIPRYREIYDQIRG